jgi:nucleoside-diphosphate-sugar epimerase
MRILITGANGYIGKTLHNALRGTHYVTVITRNEVELTNASAVKEFFSKSHFFDVVIHCAVAGGSRLQKDDWSIMDKNLIMYYNLLANRKRFSRLLHFGSGAETYMPKEPYGYSKKVIAKSILNQDNFYNIKIFAVFNEEELDTRFIKANIKRYIAKEPMQIHRDKAMDFFYMEDLVKVVEYYLEAKEPPKEFDCVYRSFYPTLKTITSDINNLDNYKVEVVYQEEGLDSYISKYRDTILPIEFIGLEQGIKNVYNKLKNEAN